MKEIFDWWLGMKKPERLTWISFLGLVGFYLVSAIVAFGWVGLIVPVLLSVVFIKAVVEADR